MDRDRAITPTASAAVEIMAIMASPFSLPRPDSRSSRKAAITTTGTATVMGARPSAEATASAPKPTWLRPSPIMEYRFSTRHTPKRAAHRETSRPTTPARTINR